MTRPHGTHGTRSFGLFLLAGLPLVASVVPVACGKLGPANEEGAGEGASNGKRIDVEGNTYSSQDPSGAANGTDSGGKGTSAGGAGWEAPAAATPIPPWAPAEVYSVFKTHCFECHFPFSFKENVLERKAAIRSAILVDPRFKPMPPAGRNPSYTTFRNTADGKVLLAWLTAQISSPAPALQPSAAPAPQVTATATATATAVASPSASPTPADSVYKWNGVNGLDKMSDLVDASCMTGCHETGGSIDYLRLETMQQLKSHRSDALARILHTDPAQRMPLDARAVFSSAAKAKLVDYLRYSAEMN